jgi:tetratricopeptide (TPR) repeat protein
VLHFSDAVDCFSFLANTKRNEEPLSIINKALELDPNSSNALDTKGLILYNLGRYDEAVVWLDQALEIDPSSNDALEHKAKALEKIRRDKTSRCINTPRDLRAEEYFYGAT